MSIITLLRGKTHHLDIDTTTRVQILDEAVYISQSEREKHETAYPPCYGLNNITAVLITDKVVHAIHVLTIVKGGGGFMPFMFLPLIGGFMLFMFLSRIRRFMPFMFLSRI